MKIGISFKENEKYIYEHINNQLSSSIYIKQLVLKDMEEKNSDKKDNSQKNKILDF